MSATKPPPMLARLFRDAKEALMQHRLLVLALLAAWFVRDTFRVGLMGGFPQDDCIYMSIARYIAAGHSPFEHFSGLPDDFTANPSEWFNFRVTYNYPTALLFYLFGEGDFTATLVPILSSLSLVFFVYWIGYMGAGKRVGVFSAWLLALFPLDVLTSTRVLTDEIFAAFTMAAVLCVLIGVRRERSGWWFMGGLCIGLAYLTKILALPLAMAFSPVFIYLAYTRRRLDWVVYCGVGILLVVAAEMACYRIATGRFFLHHFIIQSASHLKNTTEPWIYTSMFSWLYTTGEGNFTFYFKPLFLFQKDGGLELWSIGLHAYLWLAGLVYACVWRRRDLLVAIYGFVLVYLVLELVPIYAVRSGDHLNVIFFCRQLRYLVSLAPFGIVLGAALLDALYRRSRIVAIAAFAGVLGSGVPSFLHDYRILHRALSDMREVATLARRTDATIYVDGRGSTLLDYYLGGRSSHRIVQLELLKTPEEVTRGLVVLGGSRGPELGSDVTTQGLPEWIRPYESGSLPPWPTWQLFATKPGWRDEMRKYDMRLFVVNGPLELGAE